MNNKNISFTGVIISVLILFIAIADLPCGYYRFIRNFTFIVWGYGTYKAYNLKNIL